MTGVTESWGQIIAEAAVTPADAAFCASSVTLGADAVDTVSPALTLTWPMTVNEFVVAGESAMVRAELAASIVTVRCETA